jgi:hypothetical protein
MNEYNEYRFEKQGKFHKDYDFVWAASLEEAEKKAIAWAKEFIYETVPIDVTVKIQDGIEDKDYKYELIKEIVVHIRCSETN